MKVFDTIGHRRLSLYTVFIFVTSAKDVYEDSRTSALSQHVVM